jgi:hypothetical protein
MKTWEVDVDLRVRKTLLFTAPTEEAARWMVEAVLNVRQGDDPAELSSFLKWTDGRRVHRPVPVETIVDNDPVIVAVREIPG